jgi:hypothetical protein
LIAGSTWLQDEKLLAKYMMQNKTKKLIVAPHEIDTAHLKNIKPLFPSSIFYSEWIGLKDKPNNIQVLIIDNVGMLSQLYQYATICYIGGGFNKSGIHNILEAAVYGKAIIFGPHYQKFGEAVCLTQLNSAFSISNEQELTLKLDNLFADAISLKNAEDLSKQYVIEKSIGNAPFEALDSIPSKTRLGKASYSFDLRSLLIRGNFIRLRAMDKKGKAAYSNILYIRPANESIHIFPNPSNNILKIGPLNEPQATVLLLNPMGQAIQAKSFISGNQLEVNISTLKTGKYYLVLNAGGKKRVFPFIKQ